jgi:uncharacterized protein (DUF2267 family)
MSGTGLVTIDRAVQTANTWLADVARAFGTDDRRFAYRALRAWLHTLRDRLPVEATAHFAAQLPEPGQPHPQAAGAGNSWTKRSSRAD